MAKCTNCGKQAGWLNTICAKCEAAQQQSDCEAPALLQALTVFNWPGPIAGAIEQTVNDGTLMHDQTRHIYLNKGQVRAAAKLLRDNGFQVWDLCSGGLFDPEGSISVSEGEGNSAISLLQRKGFRLR